MQRFSELPVKLVEVCTLAALVDLAAITSGFRLASMLFTDGLEKGAKLSWVVTGRVKR